MPHPSRDQQLADGLETLIAAQRQFKTDVESELKGLRSQIDAIDERRQSLGFANSSGAPGGEGGAKAICEAIRRDFDVFEKSRRLVAEVPNILRKTTITSTGLSTPRAEREIATAGRFAYQLADHIRRIPTDGPSAFVVREVGDTPAAGLQSPEGATKDEQTYSLAAETIPLRVLAHWVPCSRQALQDVVGLEMFLEGSLLWGLAKKLEGQLLFGTGVGEALDGLQPSAEAFDTSILPDSGTGTWNRADVLAAAATQLLESGYQPTHAVVSVRDWFTLETLKTSDGAYLLNSGRSGFGDVLWNMTLIPSPEQVTGTFLVGDFGRCYLLERMKATIDLSDSHSDYFTKNLVAIRAEARLLLVRQREDAFITGEFSTSPA